MIQLENVTKTFPDGTVGIHPLNLSIKEGEFISVIGRSGAGKSTLLRLLNATNLPSSGQVHVLGHHIGSSIPRTELRLIRREVGFIFQQFNLIKRHSVLSNVLCGRLGYTGTLRGLLGWYSPRDIEMAVSVLKEVGIHQIHKRVDQLSGGQQQRVAIARTIVQEPRIILADEPMASLDPKLSETVLELLYKFNQERKITVLVNVHVLDLAKKRATRILGLKQGKVVFDGTPQELTDAEVARIYGD